MSRRPASLLPQQGRDELNLAEFPFAILQYQSSPTVKTIRFSDTITGKNGEKVQRQWTVAGSDAYGLPVAGDVDIMIAMLVLAQEQGLKSRQIHFTRYDLLRIMGWDNRGRNYGRVKEGLDRLTNTTIMAERAFYDRRKDAYLTCSFHIIDDYALWDRAEDGENDPDQLPLKSIVTWNRQIFRSLTTGYVKQLDVQRYFRLSTSITRQLFRYLDKKLYRDRCFQIDIFKLCHEHLGISRACKHISKLKERLTPALDELVRDGYLASHQYAPSKSNRNSVTVRVTKAAPKERPDDPSTPTLYFYQQLYQEADIKRIIPQYERQRTEQFVRQHGRDVFREFVDYVMREKPSQWPKLATLTGAFDAFEAPFLARLRERQARQEQMQAECRERDNERKLHDGYAAYFKPLSDQMRGQFPGRYGAFETHLVGLPEYQRCLANLEKYDCQAGHLSKAAHRAAEKDRQDLFRHHFLQYFQDQDILDFNAWKERHGEAILKADHATS